MTAKTRLISILLIVIPAAMLGIGCGKQNNGITMAEPQAEESRVEENTEEGYTDLQEDGIKSVLMESLGVDVSEYADSVDGVMHGSIYYVRMQVRKGSETELIQVIKSLCGEGVNASTRKRPVLNNRLAEDFEKAELFSVYDYLREGANGAKTTSVTLYTAKIDGSKNIFIFGTR